MQEYKMIAFDMDGTLLNSRKHISPETRLAIKKAVNAGKMVVLATGRSLTELMDVKPELEDFSYIVCESGALVYDSQEERILHWKKISG